MNEIKDNNEINNEIENDKKNNNNLNLKKNNFITTTNENLNKFEKNNIEKTLNSSFTMHHTNKELKNDLTSEEIENKRKKIEELKYDLGKLSFEEGLIFDNRTIK